MHLLELTLKTPAENLACDEALLDLAEEGLVHETLRFWESSEYFVVLGCANPFRTEAHADICKKNRMSILRRPSGGGAVLQGPGCLNYSLILPFHNAPPIRSITDANYYILERHRTALEGLLQEKVRVEGITDLAVRNLKFSGNAQRRKRNFLLFHGTFLLNFDLELIEKFLPPPSRQPPYRGHRSHRYFLTNLNVHSAVVKETIQRCWLSPSSLRGSDLSRRASLSHNDKASLTEKIARLIRERYGREEWNFKF